MFLVLTSTKGEQHGTFYSSIKNAPLWAHVVVSDQNNNSAEKLRVMLCLNGGRGPCDTSVGLSSLWLRRHILSCR